MFLIYAHHKTRTFSLRLYDQYGFAIEVLSLVILKFKLRSRLRPQTPKTPARKQIGSTVKFDHPNFEEIGSCIRPPDAQISSKSDDFC